MVSETIILAGGCFWCTEAVFLQLNGISRVESGYIGGHTNNPTYKTVCSGKTGHAEAIKISYDPNIISLEDIYDIYFATHDPTQLNRQGNDIGTQYRSAIFPHNNEQLIGARSAIERAQADNSDSIVTTIEHADNWFVAEKYHQDYWENDGQRNPYCMAVIPPKLAKLQQKYSDKLK